MTLFYGLNPKHVEFLNLLQRNSLPHSWLSNNLRSVDNISGPNWGEWRRVEGIGAKWEQRGEAGYQLLSFLTLSCCLGYYYSLRKDCWSNKWRSHQISSWTTKITSVNFGCKGGMDTSRCLSDYNRPHMVPVFLVIRCPVVRDGPTLKEIQR